MLKVVVNEHGKALPADVLEEVWNAMALMNTGGATVGEIADCFEESTITIGHSPEETTELTAYYNDEVWPEVQGGTPVATWDSGLIGCTMELFAMPDGSYVWSTP